MRPASIPDEIVGGVPGDHTVCPIAALAAGLFELRAALEADLRSLTWIQRSVEGVRSGCAPGDTDLLLGEMHRVLQACHEAAGAAAAHRRDSLERLRGIIDGRRDVTGQTPVAVFVAA